MQMISYLFYELSGLSVIYCEKHAVEKKNLRMNWNFFSCTDIVAVNGVSYQLGSSSLGSACLHALGDREATVLKPGSYLCQRQGSGSFRWNLVVLASKSPDEHVGLPLEKKNIWDSRHVTMFTSKKYSDPRKYCVHSLD
jgi:hypothetical protein